MQRSVFNDIVEGKVPCHKIWEDEQYLAFLDIYPRTKGHALVLPKTQYRWTYEVPDFGGYWEAARTVLRGIEAALKPVWFSFFTYGAVPYAHIHILPRYEEIDDSEQNVLPPAEPADPEELAKIAAEIRTAFQNGI
ncbi:MAG: HIT family protein [Patescibacteria group bacterium]|nr:HIT family protein [Patescibacteria group bacterium]